MPLDPDFIADCPYEPEAIFFDEVLPLELEAHATRVRGAGDKRVIVYDFRFTQNDTPVFEATQTATFMRVT